MRLSRVGDEDGFTLAVVMLASLVTSMVVLVSVSAVNGDLRLTERDLERKQAYEAAQAGLADYSFHLNGDTNYWSKCTNVPMPNAVNQEGAINRRRDVPGTSGASYAIELIPAEGQAACDPANPVISMVEQGNSARGTFRVASTGYAGDASQRIVASYKRSSFLDYVYSTQFETSDPETYEDEETIEGAYQQCTKTYEDGRLDAYIPGTNRVCDIIRFANDDRINGPLHTNDALVVCGRPTFGRTSADVISVSAPEPGWFQICSGGQEPNFLGDYRTRQPDLNPPPSNGQLANVPGAAKYTGVTDINLSGTTMTVATSTGTITRAIPSSGVVYVSQGSCATGYSPFRATYPTPTAPPAPGCGNVYVSGSYSGQLTIAAENDIIIDGNLTRSGDGLLGLIANNFIRVKHPFTRTNRGKGQCDGGSNGSGTLPNLRIDAAMLAIQHSFIVDHYDCGAQLGTLEVNGAISQRFRGAVGTGGGSSGSTGYLKNYTYDDRLRYVSPPYFLDPIQASWQIQRQTLDFDD